MSKTTVAALQIGSSPLGTQAILEHILSFEQKIIESGCQLLVMPEALLGGYPKGADFGARVGFRTPLGREQYLAYWQQAIDLDGPEIIALCLLARRTGTAITLGVIERDGTTLYCTAVYISERGELVAKHRKLMPTASERLIWGQGDGSTLPVVETSAGKIGGGICWENYMPLLRATMYAKGVQIWCAPTVDDREIWQVSMRHIAYEGRMFLISACQYQPSPAKQGIKTQWPEQQALIRGGSVIISPMGEILAGPLYDEVGLISADINLAEIVKARFDLDTVGHYARSDVFQLQVNEQQRKPLHQVGELPETQEQPPVLFKPE
jgi:nitrilase